MEIERSKACNYSAHVFLPILFGVCAGIILKGMGAVGLGVCRV